MLKLILCGRSFDLTLTIDINEMVIPEYKYLFNVVQEQRDTELCCTLTILCVSTSKLSFWMVFWGDKQDSLLDKETLLSRVQNRSQSRSSLRIIWAGSKFTTIDDANPV